MENRENITLINDDVYRSQKGYANQLIACGILLKLGYEASLAETGNSFYDLIVLLNDGTNDIPVKVGVRSVDEDGTLSFMVNTGGGKGRKRPPGSGRHPLLKDLQLWIGVSRNFDLYYFPHRLICGKTRPWKSVLQPIGSLSINKIVHTKNNTDILDNFFDVTWLHTNVVIPIKDSHTWS